MQPCHGCRFAYDRTTKTNQVWYFRDFSAREFGIGSNQLTFALIASSPHNANKTLKSVISNAAVAVGARSARSSEGCHVYTATSLSECVRTLHSSCTRKRRGATEQIHTALSSRQNVRHNRGKPPEAGFVRQVGLAQIPNVIPALFAKKAATARWSS